MYEIILGLLMIVFAGLMVYSTKLQDEQNKLFKKHCEYYEVRIRSLEGKIQWLEECGGRYETK